jgi:hypothetical protein
MQVPGFRKAEGSEHSWRNSVPLNDGGSLVIKSPWGCSLR